VLVLYGRPDDSLHVDAARRVRARAAAIAARASG
jgi:hypothetical protein